MFFKNLFTDKEFYKTFFRLAIPVAFQSFIAAALNMIDTIMVGQLGETELAAVGIANQVFFILHLFLLGTCGGASVFASQFWGKRDIQNIRRVLGLSTIAGLGAALLLFLASLLAPRMIINLFSNDQNVIKLGAEYLATVCFSFILVTITSCYAAVLRSTEEVKLPMRASVIAIITNTILNYFLIFGAFGFPKMGVKGAALATVIARLIEMFILLSVVYFKKHAVAAKLSEMVDVSRELIKRFVATTGSLIAKDMVWGVGMAVYMVVYARMGTDVVASINIVSTIKQLAFVWFGGIANACLVMVGKLIGANEETTAFKYARKFLVITIFFGILSGMLTALGSRVFLLPYKVSPIVHQFATDQLYLFASSLFILAFNMVAVVGVMRSGGDTFFCLVMDIIAVYIVGLPLAFLGGLVWKLSIVWVIALVTIQDVFKFFLLIKRYQSKKWMNNLINDISA